MLNPSLAAALFWSGLVLLAFTFAGYAWLIHLLARWRNPPAEPASTGFQPSVSVVVCAHNEADRIARRVTNLLASDWPTEQLDILIVSDGSTDATAEIVRQLQHPRVRILELPQHCGKPAALNAGLAAATGDIVVLGDMRQEFAPDTITRLVRHFSDSGVGAVSGALFIQGADSAVGGGVDAYWRMEKAIRAAEARWDSCIGCTGAVYAIRRALFTPIPEDTLIDDVVIPMQIALRGQRVLFDPEARAFDPQTLEPARERIRKRRTLAGNFQMLFRYPGWLLPWRNRLWWQLIAHKYLRLAAPFLLALLFASNAALMDQPLYLALFIGQCGFYIAALLGLARPRLRLLSLPAAFVFLNWMTLAGLWHYLRGARQPGWQPAKS
jgi:cellulose synthase/poly-beta-1,6-N-acetylglucosamine synthase-like glycosyltransferase